MSESVTGLTPYQDREIEISFPLIQKLFEAGQNIFGGVDNGSNSDYFNAENLPVRSVKLPEEFAPLTLDDNSNSYFLVYYEDRSGEYYKDKGGRKKSACISTQKRSYESNDRLKEITYSSEDSGFYLTITEKTNNRAYEDFYNNENRDLVEPNGRMKAKYKLTGGVGKELVELTASRVDEVKFPGLDGQLQPGRWLRDLQIDPHEDSTRYKELYILNRAAPGNENLDEKRAQVTFKITGKADNPRKVDVFIGFEFLATVSSKVIFEDNGVKVILPDESEADLEILRSDPNFEFLQDGKFDAEKVKDFVSERIGLLQRQWDQPQSVFEQATLDSSQHQQELPLS